MSNQPRISVIIPVYGVEKYIAKCIQSLLDQTFKEFEAIIVDDGSPDNSITIAKNLVGNDPRFVFLEKENGGQGSARNMGIDYSRGDYIAFIDSDDYVHSTYLELMYSTIIIEDADICLCNSIAVKEKDEKVIRKITNNIDKYHSEGDFLLCRDTITSFMWDKLFKKEVFIDMRFDESIRTYEDSHFVFRLIYGRKMTLVSKYLYFYVQHEGSTTNSTNPSYIADKKAVIDAYRNFIKKNPESFLNRDYLIYCYLKVYVYTVAVGISRYSKNFRNDYLFFINTVNKTLLNRKNIQQVFRSEKKVKYALLILLISPNIFRAIILLRDRIIK